MKTTALERARIEAHVRAHPGRPDARLARELGVTREAVYCARTGLIYRGEPVARGGSFDAWLIALQALGLWGA
jgi:hypothetical protein